MAGTQSQLWVRIRHVHRGRCLHPTANLHPPSPSTPSERATTVWLQILASTSARLHILPYTNPILQWHTGTRLKNVIPLFVNVAAACARSELAPLALDAYPEAYGEFKRLLLLLLEQQHHNQQQQGTTTTPPPQKQQQPQGGAGGQQRSQEIVPQQEVQGEVEVEGGRMDVDAPGQSQEQQQQQRGCAGGGGVGGGGVVGSGLGSIRAAEDAAQASSSEFADLAYFTVRNMLGGYDRWVRCVACGERCCRSKGSNRDDSAWPVALREWGYAGSASGQ